MGLDFNLPKPIRAFFNGISQVVFIENTISGMAFLFSFLIAGLEMNGWAWDSWDSWKFFVFVIIGVNLANFTAWLMGCDKNAIASGLFGFCPNLISIAAGVFSANIWTAWIMLLAGNILVVPLQIFINRFTNHHGLPGFTFPFIVMVWFFICMSYNVDLLDFGRQGVLANSAVSAGGVWSSGIPADWNAVDWGLFWTNGFEEIWVIDGFIGSLICIGGYVWANWQFGLKACMAMLGSIAFGMVFGGNMDTMMHYSLYGYSALLTVGALDTFCKTKINSGRYWFLFCLSISVTCLVNYAIGTVLGTFGLPNCTLAFVITGWIVLIVDRQMCENKEKRLRKEIA